MAVTCFIYLMLYSIVASRVSRAERRNISAATNAVLAPVPVYQQPLTSTINYQNPHHLYQPSAPVMIPAYQQVSLGNEYYLASNPHPTLYPKISNDRF